MNVAPELQVQTPWRASIMMMMVLVVLMMRALVLMMMKTLVLVMMLL